MVNASEQLKTLSTIIRTQANIALLAQPQDAAKRSELFLQNLAAELDGTFPRMSQLVLQVVTPRAVATIEASTTTAGAA